MLEHNNAAIYYQTASSGQPIVIALHHDAKELGTRSPNLDQPDEFGKVLLEFIEGAVA